MNISSDNLILVLTEKFPQFRKYKDFGIWDINDKEPAMRNGLLSVFAEYLAELASGVDISLAQDILIEINTLINNGTFDDSAIDLLGLDIFFVLHEYPGMDGFVRKFLTDNALLKYENTIKSVRS